MRKKYRSQSKLGKRPNWSQSIQPGFFSNQIAGGGGIYFQIGICY